MRGTDLKDLAAFVAVATEASFTRGAARLGMTQPALSRTIRNLEVRLGIALLTRTTRSVALTEAGEELLRDLRPAFQNIDGSLDRLRNRGQPSGRVRLTMTRQAEASRVRPMLGAFMAEYPDVSIEISVDDSFTDIVAGRFDGGIRFGSHLEKDMVAVRIGPDIRAAVVASPAYLARRPAPAVPRDLHQHDCILYRLSSSGALYAWAFEKNGRRFSMNLEGRLVFNDGDLLRAAALAGNGVTYVFADQVAEDIAQGRLVTLLKPWCPMQPGYHLYYPDRRQVSPAFSAFANALKQRARRAIPM